MQEKLALLQKLPTLDQEIETAPTGKAGAKVRDEARAGLIDAVLTPCGAEGADEARLRVLTGFPRAALEAGLQLLPRTGSALCWTRRDACGSASSP